MSEKKLSTYCTKPNQSFFEDSFLKERLEAIKFKGFTFLNCRFSAKLSWNSMQVQDSTFSSCRFNKNDWNKTIIKNCQFVNCVFIENIWQNAEFIGCTFSGCEFSKAQLENCIFTQCLIDSAKFIGECTWSGSLQETRLLRTTWPETNLAWARATQNHLYQVNFDGKAFPWTSAPETVFDDCSMGELSFVKKTVALITFSRCNFELLDLTESNITNVDFIESQFKKVIAINLNAEYLQMGRTIITEGNFDNMNLTGASIFTESKLNNATFRQAKMGMAVFEKANIEDCNFENAEFLGCNLSDAQLKNVTFADAKMKNLHLSDTITDNVTGLN